MPWQRGQFHLQQSAQAYVPRLDQRAQVARAIRSVFDSPSRAAAERRLKEIVADHAQDAPKLATWMEENPPLGLTVFAHQKRLRTSNAQGRVNQESKRRTRMARLFPHEAFLLRLVTALLAETSEEWGSGKIYLNLENQPPALSVMPHQFTKNICAAAKWIPETDFQKVQKPHRSFQRGTCLKPHGPPPLRSVGRPHRYPQIRKSMHGSNPQGD